MKEFPVKSIGIVGGGVVGGALAHAYRDWCKVHVYDETKERATDTLSRTLQSDLIFVCLPTPQKPRSLELDTGVIDTFFQSVKEGRNLYGMLPSGGYCARNFVLKSTVPIGTTRYLAQKYNLPNLVHSPEFLTEQTALIDAQMPRVNIIGVPIRAMYGDWTGCCHILRQVYEARFYGTQTRIIPSDTSEATKLFTNAFFATKIAFFNEIRSLSDKLGLEWEAVLGGMLADGRICPQHTQVPGPDGRLGFGGKCLPKDLAQVVQHLKGSGSRSCYVSDTALTRNRWDREDS